ncbi:MAG: hydrogenase expression/formation protein HypE [Nitrospirae bacterium]|nr:MAG: hydrogenase expression/formation protein HypE [Nitrospirota bacterium]
MGDRIVIGHGSGGRLSHNLIKDLIGPKIRMAEFLDSAVLDLEVATIAFTTDSYVVSPIFFQGGDIGSLAVHGTVNDLSMVGAEPICLSLSMILEEGFSLGSLETIIESINRATEKAGVRIVTGDTKVVEKGKGDGIFINTAGVGVIRHGIKLGPERIKEGDKIIVSSFIGEHGITIMAERNGLAFTPPLVSDSRPLNHVVKVLLERFGPKIKFMRDPTRGGLATVMKEVAEVTGLCIEITEESLPLREQVRGACEILGLDPLYLACEGVFVSVVEASVAEEVVSFLRDFEEAQGASLVGEVKSGPSGMVLLKTQMGGTRVVDMLTGEQLPRIC